MRTVTPLSTLETLPWVGFWAGHCFLYENMVGGAVFILQLSVCFTFRICRKPTSIACSLGFQACFELPENKDDQPHLQLGTVTCAECTNTNWVSESNMQVTFDPQDECGGTTPKQGMEQVTEQVTTF